MTINFTIEQDQHLQIEKTRAYFQGLREGVMMYAHWKSGVQYVGTTGRTLKEAINDIDCKEQESMNFYQKLLSL